MGMERTAPILLYRHYRLERDCIRVQLDKLYRAWHGGLIVSQLAVPGTFQLTDRYGLPYHGQSGLQTGFLVAFTQLIPEHQIQVFGVVKMRVKVCPIQAAGPGAILVSLSLASPPSRDTANPQTLPGIYLLISNVLVIVFGPSPYILVQFGFFVAWVYLRFFKLSENGEFRGDRSETFAFQYWFPPPIR